MSCIVLRSKKNHKIIHFIVPLIPIEACPKRYNPNYYSNKVKWPCSFILPKDRNSYNRSLVADGLLNRNMFNKKYMIYWF